MSPTEEKLIALIVHMNEPIDIYGTVFYVCPNCGIVEAKTTDVPDKLTGHPDSWEQGYSYTDCPECNINLD